MEPMKENYAIVGFKEIGKNIGGFCVKNKAHILTGLSVTGTIATGVLSARGGVRAARKIDQRERELERELTFMEKAKLCGTDFIAPTIAGACAIGGALGSDVVNTRTIGERTALLIASEKAYAKLSEKTKAVLGEKKANQIKDEIAKDKIQEAKTAQILTATSFDNAPRCGSGVLYPWVDGYSMLPFWSNPDYVNLCVTSMNKEMKELAPRGDEFDYYDKEIGIFYWKWLKDINYTDKNIYFSPERKHAGWSKGYDKDGSDDDPIAYYTTAIEWEPGFAVTMLTWEKDPSDMRLGRLMKSNGICL